MIAHALRILLGLIFIFSGISKLFPIELFDLHIVSSELLGWQSAAIVSRLIISLELFIGAGLIFNQYFKKLFAPLTILFLAGFSIYLIYQLATEGNNSNCGCFGTWLSMSPLSSLIKNLLMIGATVFVWKRSTSTSTSTKHSKYRRLTLISLPVCLLVIFLAFPLPETHQTSGPKKFGPSEFTEVNEFENKENVDLTKGYKLVAFLSIACDHCKEAAMKISILNKKWKLDEDTYFFFWGDKAEIDNFFFVTKTNYPYLHLDTESFFRMMGNSMPRIVLLKDGNIINEWSYKDFNPALLPEIPQ